MTTTKAKKLKLTQEQSNIKDSLTKTNNNLIVVARAGTGKSSTIETIAPRGSVILCFNKAPADEMAARLGSGRTASTFHSYGIKLMPKGSWMDKGNFQLKQYIQDICFRGQKPGTAAQWKLQEDILTSVSWLKTMAIKPDADILEVKKTLEDDRISLETSVDEVCEPALELLKRSAEKVKGKFGYGYAYTFDDMQWLPFIHNWGAQGCEYLFIDEAQDLNPIRMALSLQWGQRLIAVGDDRQAIYAFNGSMSNSLSLFQEKTSATALPLTVCWRCPHSHLDMARNLVPDIQDRPDCPDGTINSADGFSYEELPEQGTLIMCRTNAPLIRHYLKMRKQLSQQVVFFASEGIANAMKSFATYKYDSPLNTQWYDLVNAKFEKAINNSKTAMSKAVLQDYQVCLIEIAGDSTLKTVRDLHNFLDSEFKKPEAKDIAPNAIKLSSIHSSKGLEHHNTIVYGTSNLPHPMAKLDWEKAQETNLEYVALTRSKDSMTLIPLAE